MELIELEVSERTARGTGAVNRRRHDGFTPAVVYSEGKEAIPLEVSTHVYGRKVAGGGSSQLYRFKSAAENLDGLMTLVKAVQYEPIKDIVLHVDFLSVSAGHKIVVDIPVLVVGECPAVKLSGAVLTQMTHEVEVECIPSKIPKNLEIDVSALDEGESLHASNIVLPEGVVLRSDPGISIVAALSKMAEEEVAPAEVEATEEGASTEDGGEAASSEEKPKEAS